MDRPLPLACLGSTLAVITLTEHRPSVRREQRPPRVTTIIPERTIQRDHPRRRSRVRWRPTFHWVVPRRRRFPSPQLGLRDHLARPHIKITLTRVQVSAQLWQRRRSDRRRATV